MKPAVLESLARSTSEYLVSRNSDINGYWAIGVLCAKALRSGKTEFGFKIYPGRVIEILESELADSETVTDKLARFRLDAVDGWFAVAEDGRYPDGSAKYRITLTLSMRKGGRAGRSTLSTHCWPHDPMREQRRRVDEANVV